MSADLTVQREGAVVTVTFDRPARHNAMTFEMYEGLYAACDTVDADRERLHQVLFNLVDNAIRFTPAGGQVRIEAHRHDGSVEVSVADTGVGIPAEALPRLFERFYRVDSARARGDGGTGIGLAIARSVVEAHGGTISAESEPGHGSTFTFDLPVAEAAKNRRDP